MAQMQWSGYVFSFAIRLCSIFVDLSSIHLAWIIQEPSGTPYKFGWQKCSIESAHSASFLTSMNTSYGRYITLNNEIRKQGAQLRLAGLTNRDIDVGSVMQLRERFRDIVPALLYLHLGLVFDCPLYL